MTRLVAKWSLTVRHGLDRGVAARSRRLSAIWTLPTAALLFAAIAPAPRATAEKLKDQRPMPSGAKLTAREMAQQIDREIQRALDEAKLESSPLADDAEFIRRVSLDIHGVVPSAEKVVAFLDSKDPEKRALLIDELVASPRYAVRMTDNFTHLLYPTTAANRGSNRQFLNQWLEQAFAEKSWDRIAREIVTATGKAKENGAMVWMMEDYKTSLPSQEITNIVAPLFMGVQLKCAQCHDHKFAKPLKHSLYWGIAAFFRRVYGKPANQEAVNNFDITERGDPRKLPEDSLEVPPTFPDGTLPTLLEGEPYRPVFADWLTAPDNPYFARAAVNRAWAQFFGQGIVNPLDDMHTERTPSHPQLLQDFSEQFVANGFHLKYLVRAICNSKTYQRTSRPHGNNREDDALYSHMPLRALNGREMFDSLTTILGEANMRGKGDTAVQGTPLRDMYANFFTAEDRLRPTQYSHGVPQVLRLMNDEQFGIRGKRADAVLAKAGWPDKSPEQIIESLYLMVYSRRPTAQESERLVKYVAAPETDDDKRERQRVKGATPSPYVRVLWALVNSSEFLLNH